MNGKKLFTLKKDTKKIRNRSKSDINQIRSDTYQIQIKFKSDTDKKQTKQINPK